jgi:hypothetical protein
MTAPDHPDRRSLPLRDYDHLSVTSLAQRIRSLTAGEIGQLLDYEREHANRPAVTAALQARRSELESGATPSPGGPQAGPEWPEAPSASSPAGPTAPPVHPPPHGNPAQPGQPKADKQVP